MVSPNNPKPATAERRLANLGITLPPARSPIGMYAESVQTGNLLYLSGILPVIGHEPKFIGRLGREYDVEQGREAARIAALNVLSVVREHVGSLDKVTKVVRLVAYLTAEENFQVKSAIPKRRTSARPNFRSAESSRSSRRHGPFPSCYLPSISP